MSVVIVDPIFRASRLYITMLIANSFPNEKIKIITRKDYSSSLFEESYHLADVEIHPVVSLNEEDWFISLNYKQVNEVVLALRKIIAKGDLVFFTGLNEFFPKLLVSTFFFTCVSRKARFFLLDYDASFLLNLKGLAPKKKIKGLVKLFLLAMFSHFGRTRLIVFDERVEVSSNLKGPACLLIRRIHLVCDPFPGVQHDDHVEPFDYEKVNVLAVGLQSKRKGFDQIQKVLTKSDLGDVAIYLRGRFETRESLDIPEGLDVMVGFFSESDIQKYYKAADYIIIPYDKSFYASSGVLAYAVSMGKPIVATSHGLIGARVADNFLGFVYEHNDIEYPLNL